MYDFLRFLLCILQFTMNALLISGLATPLHPGDVWGLAHQNMQILSQFQSLLLRMSRVSIIPNIYCMIHCFERMLKTLIPKD